MTASDTSASERSLPTDRLSLQARVVSLYEDHRDGIYRFLVGHGLNPSEAQETAQDVFVDLFQAMNKGTSIDSPQAWLYAVAARAAVDYWRRKGAIPGCVDLDGSAVANVRSGEASPEMQAERVERMRQVAAGVARLPKEQRMCIQLRMQGLRYREIADVLGVSTSTAAEWLVSAVNRLRGESR
jgi:RNA polymerase sigma-70 factor (ECF subfamily)